VWPDHRATLDGCTPAFRQILTDLITITDTRHPGLQQRIRFLTPVIREVRRAGLDSEHLEA
jgi:hypothetical protein